MRVAPLGLVPKWQPTEAAELAARAAASLTAIRVAI